MEYVSIETPRLTQKEFQILSEFIYEKVGIQLPPAKKTMLEARLSKRLRILKIRTFKDYIEYLFSPGGLMSELTHMIDKVTTNKTDFFRESPHFEFLVQNTLPELIKNLGVGVRKKLMLWSAACSSGEEPYTLAMVLSEFKEKYPGLNLDYSILATDVSTQVLEKAHKGIYETSRVEPIPIGMRRKYLLKSKDKNKSLVRIVPELRAAVKFRQLNFFEGDFGLREPMDIIFCRNVLIYFDKETQEKVVRSLLNHLSPNGYFFIGHSETLNRMKLPLQQLAPAVYRKYA